MSLVGAGRARAQWWQVSSNASSIQASGRSRPTWASMASSFQCRPPSPLAGSEPSGTWSTTPGRPRAAGRCSAARSSQPVHQT
ncbi:MAG: hypothetical protein ACYC0H_05205, partial [Solirubrobacteraceae bacterium]